MTDAVLAAVTEAATLASEMSSLEPYSFFVAWNGVIVLVFRGFPPALSGVKSRLAEVAETLGLRQESFGSMWPKMTLAALDDSAPSLTLEQLTQLKALCETHTAGTLSSSAALAVKELTVVDYEQRGLENRKGEQRRLVLPLPPPTSSAGLEEAEIARVDGVLNEWADLPTYLPHAAAAGSRIGSYRDSSPAGRTCVAFLDEQLALHGLHAKIAAFRAAVDALGLSYSWLDEKSRHCTIRSLD